MIKTMVAINSTQRIYPRDPPIKTRRINSDPVLELYYYKSTEDQTRERIPKKLCRNLWGHGGVQILDANFDKSFVTPVWSFVVVSPGTFFMK